MRSLKGLAQQFDHISHISLSLLDKFFFACHSFFLPIANMIKSVEIQGIKAILYEDYSHHWEDTLVWNFLLQKYLITR